MTMYDDSSPAMNVRSCIINFIPNALVTSEGGNWAGWASLCLGRAGPWPARERQSPFEFDLDPCTRV